MVDLSNEYDIPIDTVVYGEAMNTVLKYPEQFIDILKDTVPTQRSLRYTIAINRHNEEVIEMMDFIRQNEAWYELVVKQAEKRHLSVEDNLCLNAIYVLEQRATASAGRVEPQSD